jgi:beta-galactosidase
MDYMGESAVGNTQLNRPGVSTMYTPLGFPWFNGNCGDIDLIGQPKAAWYPRRVFWGLSKLEMAVQRPVPEGRTEVVGRWGWSEELRSWSWPGAEGKNVKVRVYSSGDEVRLLVKGKEAGRKAVSPELEQ